MKKQILILTLVVLAGFCSAQSTLYKRYLHHNGIKASYVKNYRLGDLKVPVTMLTADSPLSFQQLSQELQALPYSNSKSNTRPKDSTHFEQIITANAQSSALDSSALTKLQASVQINSLNIMPASSTTQPADKDCISFFRADALAGDKGLYLIYRSFENYTYLVFHPADDAQANKVTTTLLEQYFERCKKH